MNSMRSLIVIFLVYSVYSLTGMEQQELPDKENDLILSTLHYETQPISGSKIRRREKLSFMGSASQYFANQKLPTEEVLNQVGNISYDPSLSPEEQYAQNKRFLGLLYPVKRVLSREDEHKKYQTIYELLEELLILYRHIVEELPKDQKNYTRSYSALEKYGQIIYGDKNNYYLRYYYTEGKKFKNYAISLLKNANQQDYEFKKLLLLNAAYAKFLRSHRIFNDIDRLSDQDNNDNIKLRARAAKKCKKIQDCLQRIKEEIESVEGHDSFKKIIQEAKNEEKKAIELFNQACKSRSLCEHRKGISYSRKLKKEDRKNLAEEVNDVTKQLKEELQRMQYKDEMEQKIQALHFNLGKKRYQNVNHIILGINFKLKQQVLVDLDSAETSFIKVLELYLKAFRLNPNRLYIDKAINIMDRISVIGSERIQCNSNSFTISDNFSICIKKIRQAEKILNDVENCNDSNFLEVLKDGDYHWML